MEMHPLAKYVLGSVQLPVPWFGGMFFSLWVFELKVEKKIPLTVIVNHLLQFFGDIAGNR